MKTGASNFLTDPDYTELSYLLDTGAAILLRDDDPESKIALAQIGSMPSISSVTKVELEGGVYARPEMQQQRRIRLDALLEVMDIIDFSSDMAKEYGQIVAIRGYSRRKIIDRMIGATALVCGLTLITTNGDDFTDIPGLQLEIWKA